ncbi:tankyrase-2-like [Trichogramma pretiosum]|uniref:tankyrase-2-like n=1 Tax=Trichogramma pretiosum TaxID=7493 RepID=UPI000C718E39|nr:tankyrase-2-like [Trichogramma pretiosum]
MDHLNQDSLLKLKSLRKKVNWGIEKQRVELLRRVINLFNEWNGQLPNLLDVFRFYEIDWLISEVVSKYMTGLWEDICGSERFIEFVIRTGYKNKPLVDEDGKPALNRTTPLHYAARHIGCILRLRRVVGCYDIVKEFLNFGLDPNHLWAETGDSPLHLAVGTCKRNDVVELLLRRGADPNMTNKDGLTPLHIISKNNYRDDLAEMVFEISDEKHEPVRVDAQDKFGRTPLHLALEIRNRNLMKILMRRGASPYIADTEGLTPLHYICMKDCYNEVIKRFFKISDNIDHPVRVNARDKLGRTPLRLALDFDNKHLIKFLLRHGADPNLPDASGLTPLHIICRRYCDESDFVEMLFTICDEKHQTVQVDAQDYKGDTPLFYALRSNGLKVAEYLLRRGAKLGLANKNGFTPLHFVSELNHSIGLAKMLFEFSKDEDWWSDGKTKVNAQDKWGWTPLHSALLRNNEKVAKFLLRKGSDPNLANKNGWTPLHFISKTHYDNFDLVNKLFEISNKKEQLVLVDARDINGRTPLQLAVANFLPGVVNALLDHGAELSSFVFPHLNHLKNCFKSHRIEEFKLISTSGAMPVIECLEKRGYVVDRSNAMNIMKLFIEQGLFAKSADVKINWCDEQEFVNKTKAVKINSSLSLYDLIRLRPEKAVKLVTYADCLAFSHSMELSKLPRRPKEACTAHLCEIMSRRFFRRWALESFWKLIWYRLPIECCEMIMEPLMNEDLYNICLADQNQSLNDSQNKIMKNIIKCNDEKQNIH